MSRKLTNRLCVDVRGVILLQRELCLRHVALLPQPTMKTTAPRGTQLALLDGRVSVNDTDTRAARPPLVWRLRSLHDGAAAAAGLLCCHLWNAMPRGQGVPKDGGREAGGPRSRSQQQAIEEQWVRKAARRVGKGTYISAGGRPSSFFAAVMAGRAAAVLLVKKVTKDRGAGRLFTIKSDIFH